MTAPASPGRKRRPRILVTRAEEVIGERWDDYADRLGEAGADWEALDLDDWRPGTWIEGFDGLLISAGLDVDPACYGETPSSYVTATNATRDEFETALLQDALERDLPVLAICAGTSSSTSPTAARCCSTSPSVSRTARAAARTARSTPAGTR